MKDKMEVRRFKTLRSHGITLRGRNYNSHELQGIRRYIGSRSEVLVGVNWGDIAYVSVRASEDTEWIKVPRVTCHEQRALSLRCPRHVAN